MFLYTFVFKIQPLLSIRTYYHWIYGYARRRNKLRRMYSNIIKKGCLLEILQFTMKTLPDVKSKHLIPLFMISDHKLLSPYS